MDEQATKYLSEAEIECVRTEAARESESVTLYTEASGDWIQLRVLHKRSESRWFEKALVSVRLVPEGSLRIDPERKQIFMYKRAAATNLFNALRDKETE